MDRVGLGMEVLGGIVAFPVLALLSLVGTYHVTGPIVLLSIGLYLFLRFSLRRPKSLKISASVCGIALAGWLVAIWVFGYGNYIKL